MNDIYDITEDDVGKTYDEESISIKEILGKRIIIYNFELRSSIFHEGEYVIIQIGINEQNDATDRRLLMTSSKVLIEQLKKFMVKMPYRCVINKIKGGKWSYYSMGVNKG
jgi:hypothetical protein